MEQSLMNPAQSSVKGGGKFFASGPISPSNTIRSKDNAIDQLA